jgi:toxin-antitoxin system PIN domain toxin
VTYLLDINVLVALFDSAHIHHERAHRWFAGIGDATWATCPLTENGFVRVISNPVYPTVSVTPLEAATRLNVFCTHPGHMFWPDMPSITDTSLFDLSKLRSHQQITDVYLAGLAHRRGGSLATFDTGIPVAAVIGAATDLAEIIPN